MCVCVYVFGGGTYVSHICVYLKCLTTMPQHLSDPPSEESSKSSQSGSQVTEENHTTADQSELVPSSGFNVSRVCVRVLGMCGFVRLYLQ